MAENVRNIALRLAYDGTDFVGSQVQANGPSIQGALEAAWLRLTQEQQRFTFAGRTDAGVHAQGQVANVRTKTSHPLATLQRGLNALLPKPIAILDIWEAPSEFHARHSAIWRKYRYLLDEEPIELPLLRHYVLHVGQPLAKEALREALQVLPGTHDFAAFGSATQPGGSTIRQCRSATCSSLELFGRSLVAIELVANGFLRQMIRALVGTLILVGRRQLTPAAFAQILQSHDRRRAGPTAAAHGLTLMAVGYPPAAMLLEN